MTNAPHVLFFSPIIKVFKQRSHKVVVTARDFSQTIDLLQQYEIQHTVVGAHPGKGLLSKVYDIPYRSWKLLKYAKKKKIDLCLAHNSHFIIIAAKILGIPCINMFDYEHAMCHHLNLRLASAILIPSAIPFAKIKKYGIKRNRVFGYEGLKEQMYLNDPIHREKIHEFLNINMEKVIVTIRPPADMAHYHYAKENEIYDQLLRFLKDRDNVQCVILPRSGEQRKDIQKMQAANFIIPEAAVDGPSLLKISDIVVSAGGTMNRESIVIGTPTYTIFALKMGSIDEQLIRYGLLKQLTSPSDIKLQKKKPQEEYLTNALTPSRMVDRLLEIHREVT